VSDERITIILSDLHVGGGAADPGDDHVYHDNQLVNYIRGLTASAEGQAGRLELFFNGDFFEFAQTATDLFAHESDSAWCTESESMQKLEVIINGHPDIFQALNEFQAAGNQVTIAAGNHDVDLYWEKVQDRIRAVAGVSTRFEIGKEWVERYDGLLQIGHGHMVDPANTFKNWSKPLAQTHQGAARLEMCPGTLFMVKFVNPLEATYPFADNLVPVTKLANALLRDDKSGFCGVAWAFGKFVATTSPIVLGKTPPDAYGKGLVNRFSTSEKRRGELNQALREHQLEDEYGVSDATQVTEDSLARAMFALLGKLNDEEWRGLFEFGSATLSAEGGGITLSKVVKSNFVNGQAETKEAARKRASEKNAQVVVMGHTHLPDTCTWDEVRYYNPGSWTRYLQLGREQSIRLNDLKDESKYPYALNVVRVERKAGTLSSSMICVDRFPKPAPQHA
jgi:UDP-2,3-diacylglucosamine pyrophosphatase LpxH